MPISRTTNDFEDFSDWETFEGDDDIYSGVEVDLLDDWEDDGAIAELRKTPIIKDVKKVKKPATSPKKATSKEKSVKKPVVKKSKDAEVYSILDHTNTKSKTDLVSISGPSEEELLEIENIGVESYIDSVLLEEEDKKYDDLVIIEDKDNIDLTDDFHLSDGEDFGVTILSDEDDIKARILKYEELEMLDDELDETKDIDLNVKPIFSGLGCALVTLFDEDHEVEYKLTARLAKRLAESNTNAIFIAMREGEGATLCDDERIKLASEIKKSVGNKAKIIAGVSCPSIRQSVALAKEYLGVGVDSLVIEIDANTKDVYQLVESVHKAAYVTPILIRLSGDKDALPIAPEFLYDLPIVGIIDATGDAQYLLHLTSAYSGPVYIGSTSLLMMANSLGLQGVVLASVAGDENLVKKAFGGDVDAQHELAMIERDYANNEIEQIKLGLENAFLISPTMRV